MDGYLKLYRKTLDWEWYTDASTKILFIHLLLTASFKKHRYCGVDIPAGARHCTIRGIADECGLTVQQVRTAIDHLNESGEIESESHSHFTVIRLVKWQDYQAEAATKKPAKSKNKVPKIHQERFGDDYEAYIKWWHESTGQ